MTQKLKLKKNEATRNYGIRTRRYSSAIVLISATSAFALSSCGLSAGENSIVVRVQGSPGIPYEVKLNAGNDTDVKRGNGEGEFTFTTDDCLVSVSVDSDESDTLYVGLWINDEYDDRDTSSSGYVSVSGSCL